MVHIKLLYVVFDGLSLIRCPRVKWHEHNTRPGSDLHLFMCEYRFMMKTPRRFRQSSICSLATPVTVFMNSELT